MGARKIALEKGEKYYFTGKKCPNGHLSNRYVSDKSCFECRKDSHHNSTVEEKENKRLYEKLWYKKNKERHKRVGYEWRKNNRELFLEGVRIHRMKKRDTLNAKQREYRSKNKDQFAKTMARYRKNHPEKHLIHYRYYGMIYAAIKRGAKRGDITRDGLFNLFRSQNNKCVYCHVMLKTFHFDHIIPIALGGENRLGNIQVLCPTCNHRKGKLPPDIFSKKLENERRWQCQKV